jgi:hypothetical protein
MPRDQKPQIKINKVLGLQKLKTKEYSKTKTKQTKEPKPKRLASKNRTPNKGSDLLNSFQFHSELFSLNEHYLAGYVSILINLAFSPHTTFN